jgi:hypothetical protein
MELFTDHGKHWSELPAPAAALRLTRLSVAASRALLPPAACQVSTGAPSRKADAFSDRIAAKTRTSKEV